MMDHISKAYHLNLNRALIHNADIALLPGDPFRVPHIAGQIQRRYGGTVEEVAWKREFRSFLCSSDTMNVLVTSTGIGAPSTAIVIEELAMNGVKAFIRVGTTGAIQKTIDIGDVIITTGAVRLDGASTHYAPIEYPAVAHHEIVQALIEGAGDCKINYHAGITASSDTFYPGQERYDSFTQYVLPEFQGTLHQWQKLNVLNYEMESSALLTLTRVMGLKGGCVSGVVVNRMRTEEISDDGVKSGEDNAIRAAVSALQFI